MIHADNLGFLEAYERAYAENPRRLDSSWGGFFEERRAPELIGAESSFRLFGHLAANVYPQGIKADREKTVPLEGDERLFKIYCGSIGYEFYPYCSQEVQDYIVARIEPLEGKFSYSAKEKQHILHLLNKAESFETFLHTKYVGQKRFSLEGAETLIPMLAALLEKDLSELVIGMPHRGRLNVLVNILNKTYREIFSEFEDIAEDMQETSGDVKYHKGYQAKRGELNVILPANPSHLESVNAVVEGIARARQKGKGVEKVLPVLVHGDAAIAGQGVVYESLQMSQLEGYTTGGTIHIVLNNHIGFTTHPVDSRSTIYCTDIAKTFGFPVFHVNAEDPEGCLFALDLAYDIRQRFGIDVLIDLNCWRKYGHNESDEPAFTQPLIYQVIRKKPSIRTIYHDKLLQEGVEIGELDEEFKKELQEAHQATKEHAERIKGELPARKIHEHRLLFIAKETKVSLEKLLKAASLISEIPNGFTLHPHLKSHIEGRSKAGFKRVDWALAEALAFGTILQDGVPIRLAGQDSRRGTFSQRHGTWVDQVTGAIYIPHTSISKDFEIVDSFLSEYAALGFEYGYSLGLPQALVLWEAQFGDFANGAQIVIDQYIAPGEQKWGSHSKLTLLLPHGYEGQGPEHSSARIERFLTLAAEDNIFVTNPTTPSQYFHLLRRQVHEEKPLIVFTPKGLLRAPDCISTLEDLTSSTFQEILDDTKDPKRVRRLIFCSGRIYYSLIKRAKEDTAIIRLEQLYPLHLQQLEKVIQRYKEAKTFIWAQEEPYNMGPRSFIQEPLQQLLPTNAQLEYRGRTASSSPACGSHHVHESEVELIMESLFHEEGY